MKNALLVLALAAAMAAFSYRALGHGDASWIMEGPNARCCGKQDCGALPAGDVVSTAAGYWIHSRQELVPFKEVLPSIDHQFWLCVVLEEARAWPDGRTRCFFAPDSGV